MAKIGDLGLGFGAGGVEPSVPTLSVSVSGTTATATIDGDAGVTNWLYYKVSTATEWSTDSRAGDGVITVSSLTTGVRYTFIAISQSAAGVYSLLSIPVDVTVGVSTTSVLDGLLADEADTFLAAFGEAVTYYPKGGGSRGITAIVDRNPVSGVNGVPHGNTSKFVISVKNAAADGISSSEVNIGGGDKIGFSNRIGRAAIQRRIQTVNWQDAGMMYLGVA